MSCPARRPPWSRGPFRKWDVECDLNFIEENHIGQRERERESERERKRERKRERGRERGRKRQTEREEEEREREREE